MTDKARKVYIRGRRFRPFFSIEHERTIRPKCTVRPWADTGTDRSCHGYDQQPQFPTSTDAAVNRPFLSAFVMKAPRMQVCTFKCSGIRSSPSSAWGRANTPASQAAFNSKDILMINEPFPIRRLTGSLQIPDLPHVQPSIVWDQQPLSSYLYSKRY